MYFTIYDAAAANAVGDYDTEADALGAVRRAIQARGKSYVGTWSLARMGDDDRILNPALVAKHACRFKPVIVLW